MKRREFVTRIAGVMTILSTSPAFADMVVNYAGESPDDLLTKPQMTLLQTLVDCVIPDTDTPGASAAGVHNFIHYMLRHWYTEDKRAQFEAGLIALDAAATSGYGVKFIACDPLQQEQLLTELESQRDQSRPESDVSTFVVWLKELTVMGYYTSEVGATQELRYLAIPGPYSGCIDFDKVGRTWAV